jgi:hypothetical protein
MRQALLLILFAAPELQAGVCDPVSLANQDRDSRIPYKDTGDERCQGDLAKPAGNSGNYSTKPDALRTIR